MTPDGLQQVLDEVEKIAVEIVAKDAAVTDKDALF